MKRIKFQSSIEYPAFPRVGLNTRKFITTFRGRGFDSWLGRGIFTEIPIFGLVVWGFLRVLRFAQPTHPHPPTPLSQVKFHSPALSKFQNFPVSSYYRMINVLLYSKCIKYDRVIMCTLSSACLQLALMLIAHSYRRRFEQSLLLMLLI